MGKIFSAALILLLLQLVAAVKIGVSKVNFDNTSTTSTTATTTMPTNIPPATSTESTTTPAIVTTTLFDESTSLYVTTEIEIGSASTNTTTTTTVKATSTTLKPNFTIAIFPPRLKTTKAPKIKTTTATTPTTANAIDPNTVEGNLLTREPAGSATNYCDCDLLLDACDLNCCCDRDCGREVLHVFNCNAAPKQPQLKSRLEDFQYQHGLPSCKVNDGWLCVFRTNTRQERPKEPAIDFNTDHYYKWSRPVWNIDNEQPANEIFDHYKYGEPLQFLDMKTMIVKQFDLPHTFKPPHCQLKEPLRFLKSFKTNCLLGKIEEFKFHAQNVLTFVQNTKLLLKPLKEANEPEQFTHILSDLNLSFCRKGLCKAVLLKNSTALELQLETFRFTEIKFKLLHNYTHLLFGLLEMSSTRDSLNDTELWQRYQVEYIYKNITESDFSKELNKTADAEENVIKHTSGPLGYLHDKPIIIARFIANNQSEVLSPTNQIFDYFHANSTKSAANHTILLFTTNRQFCTRFTDPANLINYGVSTLKHCKLRYSNESLAKSPLTVRNFTEICIELQAQIIAQFFSTDIFRFGEKFPDLYISQLGRPENRSDKWTPLNVHNHEFAHVSGEFNAHTHSFICRNMLLNIAYEFLVGHFTVAGIQHQALVKQATLTFGERNDLEFEMDEVIEVPLMASVMFFDYSKDVTNVGLTGSDVQMKWTIVVLNFLVLYL